MATSDTRGPDNLAPDPVRRLGDDRAGAVGSRKPTAAQAGRRRGIHEYDD